jgi:hypothetical protein
VVENIGKDHRRRKSDVNVKGMKRKKTRLVAFKQALRFRETLRVLPEMYNCIPRVFQGGSLR